MSLFNKVVWSEGMFLRPQHFQQQDRYMENLVRHYAATLSPYCWGFEAFEIDADLLQTGKLALSQCRGVMPDGTPFSLPEEAALPPALDLDETVENATVFLALPLRDARGMDIDYDGKGNGALRYAVEESEVRDNSGGADAPSHIQVGQLRFRLMMEAEERSGYHCLGVARVVQVGADKKVLFDEDYIPPCVDYRAAERLAGFVNELEGLLHQRGESLAGRVTESGRGGAAEIADFLLLQTVNRYEPLVAHLARTADVHAEALYRFLVQMAGELATFGTKEKRPPAFAEYRHDALKETFEPLMASLRQSLSMVFERTAVAIPIEERKYGIRVATIADRSLLADAMFVLAVNADVPAEALRRNYPAQVKIGPVEKIRELVNKALPGIGLNALPVAPRQIPYHAGVTYFALDNKSPFWKELERSGGLALHVSGKFPGLDMALWAIRQ